MLRKTNAFVQLLFASFFKAFFVFFLFQFFAVSAFGQGDLLITPKRVLFENNKRSEDLNLANVGSDTATYSISFINIRMKEDGSFERIDQPDSGQQFAEPFLRIFPRTVTLPPNEAQSIKLQVRRTGDMKPGEYRSHLYFRAVPKPVPLGEKPVEKDSAISIKLIPVFGISIPVIIRIGESDASVTLDAVSLRPDSIPAVEMAFQRSGHTSVYGDVAVNYVSAQGKITPVGLAKGVAVYTPITRRRFRLALTTPEGVNYHSGKLQVVFTDAAGKPVTLAQKEILLN